MLHKARATVTSLFIYLLLKTGANLEAGAFTSSFSFSAARSSSDVHKPASIYSTKREPSRRRVRPPCRRRRRGSIANIQMRRRRLAGTLPLALPWLRPLIGLYLHPVLRRLRGDEAALVGDNDGDYSPRSTASLSAPRRRFSQVTNLIHHA